jgi:hypothetical protein
MAQQHLGAATAAPYDLTRVIRRVAQEVAAGLDIDDTASVANLADKIDRDFRAEIIPDRRYRLKELEPFGYKKGRLYKAHKHLIHKDGRMSYVIGRDLLALAETAPTLAARPPQPQPDTCVPPRRRGRPRKVTVESGPAASGEAAEAGEPACQ